MRGIGGDGSSFPLESEVARLQGVWVSGARRIRTADLLGAIQALCQLSYSPVVRGWEVDPIGPQAEG